MSEPDRLWWNLTAPAGLLLVSVGLVLVAGLWFPQDFGNPDWEFGTANSFLDGLPIALIGATVVAAAAVGTGRRGLALTSAAVMIVLGVLVVLCALMIAINLPLAIRAAPNPLLKTVLKRLLAKAGLQSIVYGIVCLVLAIKTVGWARRSRRM